MKFFVASCVLLAVASAQWAPKTGKEVAQIREDCVKEENVPESLAEGLKKFEYPDEEPIRCYVKCVSAKLGVWNDETGFDADRVADQVKQDRNKDDIKAEVEKCIDKNEQNSDKCTWAYRNLKCVMDKKLLQVESLIAN
ncbi:unnamed protein product [Hermetia illucens]|uniref:Uncharacterized protein n=2 Tax=Hermetia illucens TaxID=343691 RepID=A0A7R8UR21_HERIL|nr:unnamed protein product [Hermetia illucens]